MRISAKGLGKALGLLAFGIFLSLSAIADDNTTGHIRGSVVDTNDEAVPGVTVRAENPKVGLVRTSVTNANGEFRFPQVPTGSYDVSASMSGFQTTKRSGIYVGLGDKTTIKLTLQPGDVSEVLTVTASSLLVDVTSTVSGISVRTDELMERVPIARDQTSVALLAPGSLQGDTAFNSEEEGSTLASLGGASVAENSYLVNGLNTTNFLNGTGGSNVPFEFLQELQVKTGGYQAEFGRSTGGVINTVTKSGTNEFQFGATMFFEPDSLRGNQKDAPGRTNRFNSAEENNLTDVNAYVSGPIVKDKAFFFLLYNPRDRQTDVNVGTRHRQYESDDAFWGGKLDWHITPDHTLELTAFSDTQETIESVYAYNQTDGIHVTPGQSGPGINTHDRGGDNLIFKYTGIITSNFTVSAQYGQNKFNRTSLGSNDDQPVILDFRTGSRQDLGLWSNFFPEEADDERNAYRLDMDYYVGNHSIRAGLDYESNTSNNQARYSGPGTQGLYYRYDTQSAGNSFGVPEGTETVRVRQLARGGSFDVESNSIYIQDSWTLNDNFTVNLGLRNETFDNKNATGDSFIKIDNQLAPRLGVIWDPTGDGTSKVYGNYGRYYLPIASNTNVRLSGAEFFTAGWYVLDGLNADDTPIYDQSNQLDFVVYGDGDTPTTAEIRDENIKPMYQNEFILGYETKAGTNWAFGVRGVHRNLGQTIEDVAIDAAVNQYYGAEVAGGFDYYVLANPGASITVTIDGDGDGTAETITLTPEMLGYPEAERDYYAAEFTFNRRWSDNWMLQGSYTWSHSYGNYEGWVRSDNGQDDAGLTTLFDQPGLLDHASGNLPNNRPHNLKVFGAYAFDMGLSLGANVTYRSGRPKNSFAEHPTDTFASAYESESFFEYNENGNVGAPRGSFGTTEAVKNIDMSIQYPIQVGRGTLNLRLDAFNAFDFDATTEVDELSQRDGAGGNEFWLNDTHFQEPRRIRLSAQLRF